MSQKTFACSRVPEGETCSLQITGDDKSHVVSAAKHHLETVHRNTDPDLETKVGNAVDEPSAETPYSTWI
jgi:predicted small metal-binding protein